MEIKIMQNIIDVKNFLSTLSNAVASGHNDVQSHKSGF